MGLGGAAQGVKRPRGRRSRRGSRRSRQRGRRDRPGVTRPSGRRSLTSGRRNVTRGSAERHKGVGGAAHVGRRSRPGAHGLDSWCFRRDVLPRSRLWRSRDVLAELGQAGSEPPKSTSPPDIAAEASALRMAPPAPDVGPATRDPLLDLLKRECPEQTPRRYRGLELRRRTTRGVEGCNWAALEAGVGDDATSDGWLGAHAPTSSWRSRWQRKSSVVSDRRGRAKRTACETRR